MAASTAVVNSVTGPTSPIQWTTTAGGTAIEWYTPRLLSVTLVGSAYIDVYAYTSTTSVATVRAEIAVCDQDGSNAVVWGSECIQSVTAVSNTSDRYTAHIAGPSVNITYNQRLRFRLYIDDPLTEMSGSQTATFQYNLAAAGTGHSTIALPVVLTEAPPTGKPATPTAQAMWAPLSMPQFLG